jgi:hypothetical protein
MNPLDPITGKKIISLPNQFGKKFGERFGINVGENVGKRSTPDIKPFRHFPLFIEYQSISWYLGCYNQILL